MRQTLRLFALLLRAYLRDRTALFFSLIVPLMLMVIFGYLNLGDFGRVTLAIDDQAKNQSSPFPHFELPIDGIQGRLGGIAWQS